MIVRVSDASGRKLSFPRTPIAVAPLSSSTLALSSLAVGGSFCEVTLIVNVTGAEVSTPPFAVPPLSWSATVMSAEPNAFAVGVNVSTPVALIAGATLKSAAFVLPVTLNVSVWPSSNGEGPLLIAVAQAALYAPESSLTVTGPPVVNDGASLMSVTLMSNVCAAEVSTPPFAVPPLSGRVTVIVRVPLA